MDKADHNETRDVARDTARATGNLADRYDELRRAKDELKAKPHWHPDDLREYSTIGKTAHSIQRLTKAKAMKAVDQNLAGNPDIIQQIKRHM